MVHIDANDAQAWAHVLRLDIESITETDLEEQLSAEVLAKLAVAFPELVPLWTTPAATPLIVRKIIAMKYVSWLHHRFYAETEGGMNEYALRLDSIAEANIQSLIDGTMTIAEVPDAVASGASAASFYPTDASSALEPTADDSSLGGPKFSMGTIW